MPRLRFVVLIAALLGVIFILSAILLQALFVSDPGHETVAKDKNVASDENGAPTANFSSPDVKEGEAIELRVTNPSKGLAYAFDCNTDDANGYDAPFLKQLTAGSTPSGSPAPPQARARATSPSRSGTRTATSPSTQTL